MYHDGVNRRPESNLINIMNVISIQRKNFFVELNILLFINIAFPIFITDAI